MCIISWMIFSLVYVVVYVAFLAILIFDLMSIHTQEPNKIKQWLIVCGILLLAKKYSE